MKSFLSWLSKLFSSSASVSSKRVFGAIGFCVMLVKVFMMNNPDVVIWTMGFCVSMLGLETVMAAFGRKAPDSTPLNNTDNGKI